MSNCQTMGWGAGGWGLWPWAGPLGAAPGGPVPVHPPTFDVFCVGTCSQMEYFLTYDEVQDFGVSGQFVVDTLSHSYVVQSVDSTARIFVHKGVPPDWTLEYTIRLNDVPLGFGDVTSSHIFIGSSDSTGACAGLLFSRSGLAYTGPVWFDSSGDLYLGSVLQILPGSVGLVEENEYYTVRIAADGNNGVVYIYVTKTADLSVSGHVLRFVLPAIDASTSTYPVVDGTTISCRGSALAPSRLRINSICLGTGLSVPNLPPQADAGKDQSAKLCSIVRLDGRASFDPEGSALAYWWRLIDAPSVSSFIFEGSDGFTLDPPPLVFTNTLYSEELEEHDDKQGVAVGDVLVVAGEAHNIVAKGADVTGFFVVVDGYVLDVSRKSIPFKVLKQGSISGPLTAQPSFYPDTTGIFKFDLTVSDGALGSIPSSVAINVVDSAVPRGCTPDVSFLWNYVSDFWSLVEGKEHITTFWGALAQVAATELLSLWQVEYSKSLRDIQKVFQRRWLHYDLRVLDPWKEASSVAAVPGGVYLNEIPSSGLPLAGTTLVVSCPTLTKDAVVMFVGGSLMTESEVQEYLSLQLRYIHKGFSVETCGNVISGKTQLRITAPFPFALTAASTAHALVPSFPQLNEELHGEMAAVVGARVLLVDRSLPADDVREDDLVVLGGEVYRVERLISAPSHDDWEFQRVVVKEELPPGWSGAWRIVRGASSAFLDFYQALLTDGDTASFEVLHVESGEVRAVDTRIFGACASAVGRLAVDTWPIAWFLAQKGEYEVTLLSVHRHSFMPVDPLVVSVPLLQETIKNSPEEEILRENVDFFVEDFRGQPCLRFELAVWQGEKPPERLWAETSYIDNRPSIESNFGIPAEFTLEDLSQLGANVDYLSAVRGVWFAHFNGPTMRNLRVGTQILLGLPFSEEDGVIEEIRADFSSKQGRILIRDERDQEVVRFYTYPKILPLEVNPDTGEVYKVGDRVAQFAPLVEGVEVLDYVKDPKWFEGLLSQGSVYEVEKFHRFLVRVDSNAFNLSALLFVQSFINKIKPTYTLPRFIVGYDLRWKADSIDITDVQKFAGVLSLHDDISHRGRGHWMHLNDPNSAGGGWMGKLDSGWPYVDAPTSPPSASQPVVWGLDKSDLVPEDSIVALMEVMSDGTLVPSLDTIWRVDTPLISQLQFVQDAASIDYIPAAGAVGDPVQIGEIEIYTGPSGHLFPGHLFEVVATGPSAEPLTLEVFCELNGVLVPSSVAHVTIPAGADRYVELLTPSWSCATGDAVGFFVRSTGASFYLAGWYKILITVGHGYFWHLDTQVPAGSYSIGRLM